MSQQITWNFRVIQENPFLLFQFSANFSFGAKFDNEVQQTLCRNFNHKIYNSKSFQNAILDQNLPTGTQDIFNCTSKNVWNWMKKRCRFQSISHVFRSSVEDISSFSGSILMKDSVLEALWVVDYMIEISAQSLLNFIVKFGSKAEICWKLKELK